MRRTQLISGLFLVVLLSSACFPASEEDGTADDGEVLGDEDQNEVDDDEPTPGICSPSYGLDPAPKGAIDTLEISTWNLRHYPDNGQVTQSIVEEALLEANLDFVALQEITSEGAFDDLLSCLADYDGILSDHEYEGDFRNQKLALVYRKARFDYEEHFLRYEDNGDFPRPILIVRGNLLDDAGGVLAPIQLTILHLKAGDESFEQRMREGAMDVIARYLKGLLSSEPDRIQVLLGDFNASPFRTNDQSVFEPLQDDFIQLGDSAELDHIFASEQLFDHFRAAELARMNIEEQVANYSRDVSDHDHIIATLETDDN